MGRGIYASESVYIDIDNLLVSSNTAVNFGGGFYVSGNASLNLSNTIVDSNSSNNSGGAYISRNSVV